MDAQGIVLIIQAIGVIVIGSITAIGGIYLAKINRKVDEVHEATNGAKTAADAVLAALRAENAGLRDAALAKSDEALQKSEATIQEGRRQ